MIFFFFWVEHLSALFYCKFTNFEWSEQGSSEARRVRVTSVKGKERILSSTIPSNGSHGGTRETFIEFTHFYKIVSFLERFDKYRDFYEFQRVMSL